MVSKAKDDSPKTAFRRTIYLVRHGQTEWNREERLQGGKDSPLTEEGERQAELAGVHLKEALPAFILASPLGRANRTAEIIAKALGLPVASEERLSEMRFGDAEGLSLPDVDRKWPGFRERRDRDKWHIRWPGGECYNDAKQRIAAFTGDNLMPKLARHRGQSAIIVAHETINKILLGHLLDLAPETVTRISQPNQVIYRLDEYQADHAFLGSGVPNWTPGLLQKRPKKIIELHPSDQG